MNAAQAPMNPSPFALRAFGPVGACAVALVLATGASAGPQPTTLRAEAAAARAEQQALSEALVASAQRLAQAEAETNAARARIARFANAVGEARAIREADQTLLARAVVDLSLIAKTRPGQASHMAGVVAAQTAVQAAARLRLADQALGRAATVQAALDLDHRALATARRVLAEEQALIADAQTRKAALAQTLELKAEAAAKQRRKPAVGPSTARVAPVAGRVSAHFGARMASGAPSQGVRWRTRPGARVVAPADGRVSFSGPFRDYGQVLILDLAGESAVILVGFEALAAQTGQSVLAGEPLGALQRTPVWKDGAGGAELYMEVRAKGRAVDPLRWLARKA